MSAQPIAQVIAQYGSNDPDRDHPVNTKTGLLVSEKTGEHEQGLSRKRQSDTLAEKPDQESPVTPRTQQVTDGVIDPVHPTALDAFRGYTSLQSYKYEPPDPDGVDDAGTDISASLSLRPNSSANLSD